MKNEIKETTVETKENKDMMIKDENGKEVIYLKITSGTHVGKVIRFYGIRKDGPIFGKDLESKKVLVIGKGSVCEEFRKLKNLDFKSGRTSKDYSSILEEMK